MNKSLETISLKQRFHATGWLILANAILSIAISTRYFAYLPTPPDAKSWLFVMVSVLGQMPLLAGVIGLVCLPFALIPYSHLRRTLLALVASIGIGLLVVDTFVFAQYRFHINAVVVNMILAGQIVSFPLITWITVIGGCALVFALEWWMVKTFEGEPSFMKRKIGRRFSLLVFLSLLVANGMHVWAAAYGYQPITTVKRFLPLYMPATANKFMSKHGFVDQAALDRQNAMKMKGQSTLNYPLSPLKTEAVEQPVNIMVIAVDSWRGDTFNADNTPNMWHYARVDKSITSIYPLVTRRVPVFLVCSTACRAHTGIASSQTSAPLS